MRLKSSWSLLALVLSAVAAYPAAAQNPPGTWELTADGGVNFGAQIFQGGNTTIDVDTAGTFGGRLGYNVNRAFQVEFAYGHTTANLNATNYGLFAGGSGKIGHIAMDTFEGGGLWHWGTPRASGYVVLGLGAMSLNPSVNGASTSSSTKFTYSFGLGGKFAVSENAAIRVEGRFRGTDIGSTTSQGVWCDFYYCYAYSSSWYTSGEITGGLTFRFGGK